MRNVWVDTEQSSSNVTVQPQIALIDLVGVELVGTPGSGERKSEATNCQSDKLD